MRAAYARQQQLKRRQATVPLDLHVDTDSFVPYYQQVVEQIRALVKSAALREGDVFYSEGEIAGLLGISKMPVRQAFLKLRSEGLLIIEKGKRPVVGSSQVPWNFQQLRGFSEEMRRRGLGAFGKGAESETRRGQRRGRPRVCTLQRAIRSLRCGGCATSTTSRSHW